MRIAGLRFSLKFMLAAMGVAGLACFVGAKMKRGNEERLSHLVFNVTLQAKTEVGDLSAFDVTAQWVRDYRARVDFRPKDGMKSKGRSYTVVTCSCGLKMDVRSSPLR